MEYIPNRPWEEGLMAAPAGEQGWQHNLLICFAGCSKGYFSWGARTPIYNLLICFAGATDGCASPSGATESKPRVRSPARATKPWVEQHK